MNRRKFLLLASAGGTAIAIPTVYYALKVPDYDKSLIVPRSLSMIWETETILATGKKYIEKFPDENSERALTRSLFADSQVTHDHLESKSKSDFESSQYVIIDGWMLSRTEARQCALFAIHQSKTS